MHLLSLLTAFLVMQKYNLPESERETERRCEACLEGREKETETEGKKLIPEYKEHSKRVHPIIGFFILKKESYFSHLKISL